MAVPMKGEALVRVAAGDFTLAFNFAAAVAIEEDFGKPIEAVVTALQAAPRVADMARILQHGLAKHHGMSLEQVLDVVMIADMAAWGDGLGRALGGAQAQGAGEGAAGGAARPRKRR